MTYLKSFDGTKIYYEYKKKSDKTIVFVHGWVLNHTSFKKESDFLFNEGFSVLNYDLRGHGNSSSPSAKKDYSLDCFAKDLKLLIEKNKLKNIILVGHSMGGMIILKFMEKYSYLVEKIILIDTTYHNPLLDLFLVNHLTKTFLKISDFLMNLKKKPFVNSYVDFSKFKNHFDYFYWLQGSSRMTKIALWSCFDEILNLNEIKELKKIKVPTLIIEGKIDWVISKKVANFMKEKIHKSKLVLIHSTHDSVLKSSDLLNKAILKFIKKE